MNLVGISTVSNIISETSDAVYEALSTKVLLTDPSEEDWKKVSNEFEERWNMPHCVGAADGRHMLIQVKLNRESFNFRYLKL